MIRIVICSPGSSFSKNFRRCWTNLLHYCWSNKIEIVLADAESNNIYYVRTKCLGGDCLKGIYQKPWQGQILYNYILWIDSDMTFSPDQLQKLIDYNEPIVTGFYNWQGGNGLTCGHWDIEFYKTNGYMPYLTEKTILEQPKNDKGLIEVDYAGFGFLLVKYGIFEKMEYPWFRSFWTTVEINNKIISDFSMEDVAWCLAAKKLGYKILVDPTMKFGHEKTAIY